MQITMSRVNPAVLVAELEAQTGAKVCVRVEEYTSTDEPGIYQDAKVLIERLDDGDIDIDATQVVVDQHKAPARETPMTVAQRVEDALADLLDAISSDSLSPKIAQEIKERVRKHRVR